MLSLVLKRRSVHSCTFRFSLDNSFRCRKTLLLETEELLLQFSATSGWCCNPWTQWAGPKWRLISVRVPDTMSFPHTKHFLQCCPSINSRRVASTLFKIDGQSFLFFALLIRSLSFSRFLILFSFLISGNVHPNPEPIFCCLVYAGSVTWSRQVSTVV